jgi:hypothetical protein
MANDDDKPMESPRPSSQVSRPKAKAPAARPFDMWLHKQLHAMYDEIASEPLPNDLLDLIDGDAAESGVQEGHTAPPKKPAGDDKA